MTMDKTISIATIVFVLLFSTSCNVWRDLGNTETDEAILFHVESLIDQGAFAFAIERWYNLSPGAQEQRENIIILASAWAGQGGLNLITLVNSLNNNNSSGTPSSLFLVAMTAMVGSDAGDYEALKQAQHFVLSISSDAQARTTDENIFMLFVQFAKLGALFAARADTDADSAVDAGFDGCDTNVITDADANEVIAAIGNILTGITATGSSLVSGSLSDLTDACTTLETAAGVPVCSLTDPGSSTIDATARQVARTLVVETALNIGLASDTNVREFNPPAGAGALCP